MTASNTNRETVRDAFVALLTTDLVGAGKPCQAIYGYQVGDFQGQSPVVVVSSAGSEREQRTVSVRQRTRFYLNIYTFVLYSDENTWGEDDAEDRMDLIEKTIADTIANNRSADNWAELHLSGRTRLDSVLIGNDYRREVMEVVALVFDN